MLVVTEKAAGKIKDFLQKQQGSHAIRILLQPGWGGPKLGMALDEPQKNDVTFADQGISFAIEKGLFDKAKPIQIDYVEALDGSGFQFTSSLQSGGGCCWFTSKMTTDKDRYRSCKGNRSVSPARWYFTELHNFPTRDGYAEVSEDKKLKGHKKGGYIAWRPWA